MNYIRPYFTIFLYSIGAALIVSLSGALFWFLTFGAKIAFLLNKFVLLHLMIAFAIIEIRKNYQKKYSIENFWLIIAGAIGFQIPMIFETINSTNGELNIILANFAKFALILLLYLIVFSNKNQSHAFVLKLAGISIIYYFAEYLANALKFQIMFYPVIIAILAIAIFIVENKAKKQINQA